MQDTQKNKLYSWEQEHVFPTDKSHVAFDDAQTLINYIWEQEGCEYPPKVQEVHQNAAYEASANRLVVNLRKRGTKTTILLHELAHSFTSRATDGASAAHGPRFVGYYIHLLTKYAGYDFVKLAYAARKSGLEFNMNGKVF